MRLFIKFMKTTTRRYYFSKKNCFVVGFLLDFEVLVLLGVLVLDCCIFYFIRCVPVCVCMCVCFGESCSFLDGERNIRVIYRVEKLLKSGIISFVLFDWKRQSQCVTTPNPVFFSSFIRDASQSSCLGTTKSR
jgi:hypothetical protein